MVDFQNDRDGDWLNYDGTNYGNHCKDDFSDNEVSEDNDVNQD